MAKAKKTSIDVTKEAWLQKTDTTAMLVLNFVPAKYIGKSLPANDGHKFYGVRVVRVVTYPTPGKPDIKYFFHFLINGEASIENPKDYGLNSIVDNPEGYNETEINTIVEQIKNIPHVEPSK